MLRNPDIRTDEAEGLSHRRNETATREHSSGGLSLVQGYAPATPAAAASSVTGNLREFERVNGLRSEDWLAP